MLVNIFAYILTKWRTCYSPPKNQEDQSHLLKKLKLIKSTVHITLHLIGANLAYFIPCGNYDKVSRSYRSIGCNVPIRRTHNALCAVTDDGMSELCSCGKANAIKKFLPRIFLTKTPCLQVFKNVHGDGIGNVPLSALIRLNEKMVFFYGEFFHTFTPS